LYALLSIILFFLSVSPSVAGVYKEKKLHTSHSQLLSWRKRECSSLSLWVSYSVNQLPLCKRRSAIMRACQQEDKSRIALSCVYVRCEASAVLSLLQNLTEQLTSTKLDETVEKTRVRTFINIWWWWWWRWWLSTVSCLCLNSWRLLVLSVSAFVVLHRHTTSSIVIKHFCWFAESSRWD